MKLSIIIVNYNVKYFLEQCLHSVLKACRNIESEIFVSDNHSTDGSREWLPPRFPTVKFVWQEENTGFAKANNRVLRSCRGEFVLFLNPDTIVAEDCFVRCIEFFEQQQGCGALGVRMIDGSGKFLPESKRSFPTAQASIYKMLGLATMFPHSRFARYHAGHIPENKSSEVEVLAGAFIMARKKILDELNGFDEDFFMYGEDIDLSYRIQQTGFKNFYFPDVTIIHFKGESTQKLSQKYIDRFYGAMSLFVKKHQKNAFNRNALLAAIAITRRLAFAKLFIKKQIGSNSLTGRGSNETLVIGTHEQFNKLLGLIKHAVPPQQLIGRLSVEAFDKQASLGNLNDIDTVTRKYKPSNIILCEGVISFEKIISLTERMGNVSALWFYSEGSDSIISSHNKSTKGAVIAADSI